MFSIQRKFFEQCQNCSAEDWQQITNDPRLKADVEAATAAYREHGKGKEYDKAKKRLPLAMYCCTFDENTGADVNKPKPLGRWRNQASVRLNGLAMYDADELSKLPEPTTPVALFHRMPDWLFDAKQSRHVVLVHVTPSGDGLRVVFTCDAEKGNLADHQQWLSTILGVPCDKAVKDASRGSFMVHSDYILYQSNELITYDNEDYREKFNQVYRSGNSAPSTPDSSSADHRNPVPAADTPDGSSKTVEHAAQSVPASLGTDYRAVSYSDIVKAYCVRHPDYNSGDRHAHLLKMAGRLRYICDNNPDKLKQLVRLADYVQQWEQEEQNGSEINRICNHACQQKFYSGKPKDLQDVLRRAGVKETAAEADDEDMKRQTDAMQLFAERLQRETLPEPYRSVCEGLDPLNHVAAIFASGTMFCTLMTRCWYRHYDGQQQRMNPQALIIGDPASGKAFAEVLDQWIMGVLRNEDEYARRAERRFKEEKRERQTSSKAQKGEALKRPELPIRYLPTNTSNAVFFRRLFNAKEERDGETMPLHLYMFDSELMSANKRNGGADWIGKRDLELKAFHNEVTGVDYANDDSINESLPVFWNTVTTGTKIALGKKFSLANINDGLCTRVAIAPMADNHFVMLERGNFQKYFERRARIISMANRLAKMSGELQVERLVDHVYNLCDQSANDAREANDLVLDLLRKRAVFYATWYTIPVIAWRFLQAREKDENAVMEVTDADIRLATFIYDAVVYWQDAFFGQMLQEAWENGNRQFVPRKKNSRNAENYAALKEEFKTEDVVRVCGIEKRSASKQIQRWIESGYVERVRQGHYRKIVRTIL